MTAPTPTLQEQIDALRAFLVERLDAMITKQDELKRQTDDLIEITEDDLARRKGTDARLRLLEEDCHNFKGVVDEQLGETERRVDDTQDRVIELERRLDLLDDSFDEEVVRSAQRHNALEQRVAAAAPMSVKRKRESSRKPPPRAAKKVKR